MTEVNQKFKIHQQIFKALKKKALSFEGRAPRELKEYRKNHEELANRRFLASTLKELLESIKKSNIVYLGDFHTFDQSSKNIVRILNAIQQVEKKIIIAVEFIHQNKQHVIDNYLSGAITELEFLEDINYQESWRFPWNHYKQFFDLAKNSGLQVVGLNSIGQLQERDTKAAEIISQFHGPGNLIIVIFGELHMSPNKLPQKVSDRIKATFPYTIVHQNLEAIYWQLAKNGVPDDPIVKFNQSEFVIQTSPPWIKYESMIYWYQHLSDDPSFDIHEYIIEFGTKLFDSNAQDNFLFISKAFLEILNQPVTGEILLDYNLYDHSGLSYVSKKLKKVAPKSVANFYARLLLTGKSFKLPYSNDFYCSNYSVNRLSYLAGKRVFDLIIKLNNPGFKEQQIYSKGGNEKRFIFFFYQSLMGYLSSKILNPYLKCDMYQDLARQLSALKNKPALKKKLQLTLDILDGHSRLHILLKSQTLRVIYSSAFLTAHIVADSIFENFYKTEKKEFYRIMDLVTNGDLSRNRFIELKSIVFPNNEYKIQKKRFF